MERCRTTPEVYRFEVVLKQAIISATGSIQTATTVRLHLWSAAPEAFEHAGESTLLAFILLYLIF
jgi:hypothetical protein